MDMPATPTKAKKLVINKELKQLFIDAAEERRNATSRLVFELFRKQVELAYYATTDTARRANLGVADKLFTQIFRAEKGEDTETLLELEQKLAQLSEGSDVYDI